MEQTPVCVGGVKVTTEGSIEVRNPFSGELVASAMPRPVRLALSLAAALLLASCFGGTTEITDPPAEGVILRIVVDGAVTADWTIADLEDRVPSTEIMIDGVMQAGPLLVDVIAASGVENWQSGEVFGMGEGRTFEVKLDISSSEVDNGWILDVTKQGTLKLAAVDLPREEWVRDVSEIRLH